MRGVAIGMSETLSEQPAQRAREPRIAIVGAGMSGIALGVELKRAGFDDFVILEKGERVGGVWNWNHYPGLSCDVPSHLYQYGFHLKPDWKRLFATGDEIRRYHEEVATAHGLSDHIRLRREVTGAKFEDGSWKIQTAGGQELEADFVVMATGVLHHPNTPEIPGLESFAGRTLHSAQWDDSVSAVGKRVAVIGTGSTGVQLVSAFQPEAARVTLFARKAQWVIWAPTGLRQPRWVGTLLARFPSINRSIFDLLMRISRGFTDITTRPSWRRKVVQSIARLHLKTIRNPELRAKLTPDYEPLCKRQVVSGSFYRAVQKPNVDVVNVGIDHVEPAGIVDSEGKLHELDLIVFATGFKAHNYMRPMNLVGRDGVTIDQAWNDGPRAYLMTALPGFPNLFTMLGPNSPVGSIPLHHAATRSARYIVDFVSRFAAGELDTVEVTQAATDRFNEAVRVGLEPTVWNTGCNSWYFKQDGTVDLWPFSRERLERELDAPTLADFAIEQSSSAAEVA